LDIGCVLHAQRIEHLGSSIKNNFSATEIGNLQNKSQNCNLLFLFDALHIENTVNLPPLLQCESLFHKVLDWLAASAIRSWKWRWRMLVNEMW